jgi:hypothetical protein
MRRWIAVLIAMALSQMIGWSASFSIQYHSSFPASLNIPSRTSILVPGLDPRIGVLEGFYVDANMSWVLDGTLVSLIDVPWRESLQLRLISWLELARVMDTIYDIPLGILQPGQSVPFHVDGQSGTEPYAPRVSDPQILKRFNRAGMVPLTFDTGYFDLIFQSGVGDLTGVTGRVTSGTVNIFYEYRQAEPPQTPEPATPLLFVAGLSIFLVTARLGTAKAQR